jgi:hypothetical protein
MKRNVLFAVSASAVLFALSSLFSCKEPPVIGGGSGGRDNSNGGSAGSSGDAAVVGHGGGMSPSGWVLPDVPPAAPDLPEEVAPPTGDANCGSATHKTKRSPVDVLLVLDRSASMDWSIAKQCYCNNADLTAGGGAQLCDDLANCTTRWNAIKDATKTTLAKSTYVNWGLKFFMSPDPASGPALAQCTVNKEIEVPVAADKASEIQSKIEGATKSLSTPTTAAINVAVDYLKTVDDGNKKFILLATDGEPNCGPGSTRNPAPSINNVDVTGATAAMTAAKAAGFTSYVVGIGPETKNLTALAQAGAGRDYFPAGSADELAKALSAINQMVISCIFSSDTAPEDPKNVAVYVNGQRVEQSDSDGWKFGATNQEIELTGKFCQELQSGADTDVQILFGCKGTTYFPPDIY